MVFRCRREIRGSGMNIVLLRSEVTGLPVFEGHLPRRVRVVLNLVHFFIVREEFEDACNLFRAVCLRQPYKGVHVVAGVIRCQ